MEMFAQFVVVAFMLVFDLVCSVVCELVVLAWCPGSGVKDETSQSHDLYIGYTAVGKLGSVYWG